MHVRTTLRAKKTASVILSSHDESPPPKWTSLSYILFSRKSIGVCRKRSAPKYASNFFWPWLFCAYKIQENAALSILNSWMGNPCPPLQLCAPASSLSEWILHLHLFGPFKIGYGTLYGLIKSSCMENSSELLRKCFLLLTYLTIWEFPSPPQGV